MTQRVVNGQTYNLSYDAENRLVLVSGNATASFAYDADGARVREASVMDGETTVFVGGYYEVVNPGSGSVTKYYMAGTSCVALDKDGTVSYLLADHLGSSSISTDAAGNLTSVLMYKAWGETRYSLGNLGTDYKFTGQREEASLGIYFFNARWYDGTLGRFLSPDSIVPTSTQGTQAWDRYAFVNNNPVRYTDPTGHFIPRDDDHSQENDQCDDTLVDCNLQTTQDDPLDNIVEEDDDGGSSDSSGQAQTAASSQTTVNMRWIATGLIAIGVAIAVTAVIFSPLGIAALAAVGIGGLTAFSASTLGTLAVLAASFVGGGALVNSAAGAMDAQANLPTATPTPTATLSAPHGLPFSLVTPTSTPNP